MLRTQDKRIQLGRPLPVVFPSFSPPLSETATASGTSLVAVATHASANTKASSYTEIIAATAFDADGFTLLNTFATARDMLVDVALGAAGSEVNIIANLHVAGQADGNAGGMMYVPLPVPAGSRVSANAQGVTGGTAVGLGIVLSKGEIPEALRLVRSETYGAATADSGGTGLDPGGSAATESGWIELTAATTIHVKTLWVTIGNRSNATIGATTLHKVDIAVGAAASEVAVVSDLSSRQTATNDSPLPVWHGPVFVDIPVGSRISARCMSSSIDAADRLIDVTVIGFGQ